MTLVKSSLSISNLVTLHHSFTIFSDNSTSLRLILNIIPSVLIFIKSIVSHALASLTISIVIANWLLMHTERPAHLSAKSLYILSIAPYTVLTTSFKALACFLFPCLLYSSRLLTRLSYALASAIDLEQ